MDKKGNIVEKAGKLIAARTAAGPDNYCALATVDQDGYPYATTISISKSQGIGCLIFCTGAGTPTVLRLKKNPKACVCLNSPEYHIALIGEAEVLTDLETKRDMWYEGLADHFSGPEDENLAVIRFRTQRYSLFVDWNSVKGEV